MNRRQFYSLPDPREVGLRWKPFEQQRKKIERIEGRLREAQKRRAEVHQRIQSLGGQELSDLSRAILAGEDEPSSRYDEHEQLKAEERDLALQEEAISIALGQADEEMRLTVYENQPRWKEEADRVLKKAIAEERKAYDEALKLIQEPRRNRIYAEALSQWVRNVGPTFGEPSDVAALSAMQNLGSGAHIAKQKLQERRQAEALQEQQQEEGVA